MPTSPEMSLYVNCHGFQTVRIELYCNYILFEQGHKNKSLVLSSITGAVCSYTPGADKPPFLMATNLPSA